jgi:hypothetical protein
VGLGSALEEVGLKRVAAVACLVSVLVLPHAASAATIAPIGAATAVREYAGTIVFSQFDQAAGQWYLTVRRAGAVQVERLSVAPSTTPFEADIGLDIAGRPELIYQRCGGTAFLPTGCDLFLLSLDPMRAERPVRNANNPDRNDFRPTLWSGRLAWVREYGSQTRPNPVVYTRRLTAPRSRRSQRLAGVPRRRCGDVEGGCGRTTGRAVDALELRADKLALVTRFACRGCSGIQQSELRLDDLRTRTSRQVAFQVIGLSGQSLVGPSFFAGRLAWYKSCSVDPGGCRRGGPFRYRLSTRRYERGKQGPVGLDGFADTGSRLYMAVGCGEETQPPFSATCRIDEVAPPSYSATPRLRR